MGINQSYKHILCIRADNMGDVIMSGPAIRALKRCFGARITLLTSESAKGITSLMPEIDETIAANLPWVSTAASFSPLDYNLLVDRLKMLNADLAVIFTVYSQSALPAALLCWQAGIKDRLAYCRENPYDLLTQWLPDEEPYAFIRHQVERDVDLVRFIGAEADDDRLRVDLGVGAADRVRRIATDAGVDMNKGFILLHPGVSEAKREYPVDLWIESARLLYEHQRLPLIVTGTESDHGLVDTICKNAGPGVYDFAGKLSIRDFASLIAQSRLVISVNTVTAHLAAAVGTPLIVLYALTNPQHTPWRAEAEVLFFPVPEGLRSRNPIIRFVSGKTDRAWRMPSPTEICTAAERLLAVKHLQGTPG